MAAALLFANPDPLGSEEYLVIADLGWRHAMGPELIWPRRSRLRDLETLYTDLIRVVDDVAWDHTAQVVRATRQRRLGPVVLSRAGALEARSLDDFVGIVRGHSSDGTRPGLAWTQELRQWRARVSISTPGREGKSHDGPICRTRHCCGRSMTGLSLSIRLDGVSTASRGSILTQPLHALLSWEQSRQLERWAPTHLTVPSVIERSGWNMKRPICSILAVRLARNVRLQDTPRLVDAKIPVMLQLPSPARRPVQITKDLSSFWKSAYREVKELRAAAIPNTPGPTILLTALPTPKPNAGCIVELHDLRRDGMGLG